MTRKTYTKAVMTLGSSLIGEGLAAVDQAAGIEARLRPAVHPSREIGSLPPPYPENRARPVSRVQAQNIPEFSGGFSGAETGSAPNPGHGVRAAAGAARKPEAVEPGAWGASPAHPVRQNGTCAEWEASC